MTTAPAKGTGIESHGELPGRDTARYRVHALALSQLVSYGSLYYSFGAVLPAMSQELELSLPESSAVFSAGLVASAPSSLVVGFLLDRIGAKRVLLIGGVAGTAALLAWSQAPSYPLLLAAWIAIGLASPFVFYETVFFAVMQQHLRRAQRSAISTITVIGGLASTVYIPLVGLVAHALGWRAAVGCTALVFFITFVTLVPTALAAPPSDHRHPAAAPFPAPQAPGNWMPRTLVIAASAAPAAVAGAVAAHYVILLVQLGHELAAALFLASLLGVAATSVRFLARRWMLHPSGLVRTLSLGYAAQAVALVALSAWGSMAPLAAAATLVIGGVLGLGSLARPLLVADYLGVSGFGRNSGLVSAVTTLTRAGGPAALGALAVAGGGLAAALPWLVVFLGVGIFCVAVLGRLPTGR